MTIEVDPRSPDVVPGGLSRRQLTLGLSAFLLGAAAGPASAHAEAPSAQAAQRSLASRFVGRVAGSNAYIAVVKDGRKVAAYVCNDGAGGGWIESSSLRNGRALLRSGGGEAVGRVKVEGDVATGTVEVAGRRRRFSARRVRGGDGGLYFAVGLQRDRLLVGGWIFLPDGTQRGAVAGVNTGTLEPLATTRAPRLNRREPTVELGEGEGLPPVVTEPQGLVVIAIIGVLIALLVPAVQNVR